MPILLIIFLVAAIIAIFGFGTLVDILGIAVLMIIGFVFLVIALIFIVAVVIVSENKRRGVK